MPRLRTVGAEPVGHRGAWQPGELAETANAKLGELAAAVMVERQQIEGERLPRKSASSPSSTTTARQGGAMLAAASAAKRRPAAPTRGFHSGPAASSAWRGTGAEATGETLDARGIEVGAARLDRLDGEAGVLGTAEHALPLLVDSGWILLEERERRARGERLPEPHAGPNAGPLGLAGARADEVGLSRRRSQGHRMECEVGPGTERCSEGKRGNRDAGDHGNICSTRTCVLLSRGNVRRFVPLRSSSLTCALAQVR